MKPDHHSDALPVRLVILFVGVIGVLSLLIGAWLFWLGKSGEGVLAITNGCVMGLLGLLARTESRQRQNDQKEPVEVTATEPIPVEEVGDGGDEESEAQPSPLAKAVRK